MFKQFHFCINCSKIGSPPTDNNEEPGSNNSSPTENAENEPTANTDANAEELANEKRLNDEIDLKESLTDLLAIHGRHWILFPNQNRAWYKIIFAVSFAVFMVLLR